MNFPKLSTILIFIIFFVIGLGICTLIVYNMASMMCVESEVKPVRYEMSGLFGNQKIPIVTIDGNHDSYERVCIRSGEPRFFSLAENLDFIVKQSVEESFKT